MIATCQIVSLDWLIESIQAVEVNGAKKPFPEIGYILGSVQNGISQDVQKDSNKDTKSVIQKDATSDALKVIKSDVLVDANSDAQNIASMDSQTDTKNDQENSAKKRHAAQVDGIEEDSSKKQKDAQKAGFKNLNIPVDEAFLREHVQHKGE